MIRATPCSLVRLLFGLFVERLRGAPLVWSPPPRRFGARAPARIHHPWTTVLSRLGEGLVTGAGRSCRSVCSQQAANSCILDHRWGRPPCGHQTRQDYDGRRRPSESDSLIFPPPSTRHREGDDAGRAGTHPRRGRPPPPPSLHLRSQTADPVAAPIGAALVVAGAALAARRVRGGRVAPFALEGSGVAPLPAPPPVAAGALPRRLLGIHDGRRPVRGRHPADTGCTVAHGRLSNVRATTTVGTRSCIAGSGDKQHQHHRDNRHARGRTGKAGRTGASHGCRVGGEEKHKRCGEGAERGVASRVGRAVGGVNGGWGGEGVPTIVVGCGVMKGWAGEKQRAAPLPLFI